MLVGHAGKGLASSPEDACRHENLKRIWFFALALGLMEARRCLQTGTSVYTTGYAFSSVWGSALFFPLRRFGGLDEGMHIALGC